MCKGTKNVPIKQNEVHKVPIAMGAKCYLHIIEWNCRVLFDCIGLCGHMWPYVALCDLMWPYVALCGLEWLNGTLYVLVAFHDHV